MWLPGPMGGELRMLLVPGEGWKTSVVCEPGDGLAGCQPSRTPGLVLGSGLVRETGEVTELPGAGWVAE